MCHNLMPSFTRRANGIEINDVPKIDCEDPVADDHSVSFKHSDLRILLQLNGMSSHFQTRMPGER